MNTRLMASQESFEKCHQGGLQDRKGRGKEGKLNEFDIRAMSRGHKLIGKYKMAG